MRLGVPCLWVPGFQTRRGTPCRPLCERGGRQQVTSPSSARERGTRTTRVCSHTPRARGTAPRFQPDLLSGFREQATPDRKWKFRPGFELATTRLGFEPATYLLSNTIGPAQVCSHTPRARGRAPRSQPDVGVGLEANTMHGVPRLFPASRD